jgi:hypothetical protein
MKINTSDERLGQSVDRLIGIMLLLEHCKQYKYFDLTLSQFTDIWQGGTFNELQQSTVDSISCPILKKVFASDCNDTILPNLFVEHRYEERIRNSLWLLLSGYNVPLWLFGDYHQLCVANPYGKYEGRKRSSQTRYARGIHYTPAPIVDYLTATILDNENLTDIPRILDPSCGCGSFLIAAFRYLVEKMCQNESTLNREQVILDILGQSLFGVDIDSQAIDWTMRLLYLESRRLIGADGNHTIPDISSNFFARSFFDVNHQAFGKQINTIIGGPPFVCYRELKKSQPELTKQLQERFTSTKTGQFDLYMPFIEHAVNLLENGNKVGFSLSNSFLHTDAGKKICHFLLERSSPLEVLEFSESSIYPDAPVQIALLSLIVGKDEQAKRRHVFLNPTKDTRIPLEQIFVSHTLPIEMGKVTPLGKNELTPKVIPATIAIQSNTIDKIRFGDLPIEFFNGAISKSDEIFMMKDCGFNFRGIQHGLSRQKERICCEKELTIPIIRGREIKGFRYSLTKYFYLTPYIERNLIKRTMLEKKYPLTFQYLMRFDKLFAQERNEEWYAYHALPAYRSNEVIVSCKIVSTRSFARMELSDKTIHGSAFGIATKDESIDIRLLLLYLNSTHFWNQLEATMPPIGITRRAIRMSIFKDLLIPKQIVYPTANTVDEAHILEKRISQIIGRRKIKEIKTVFAELDSFIVCCISK